jgi:hypothetical protein
MGLMVQFHPAALRALSAVLVLACAGCSSSEKYDAFLFVNPGKYEWSTCDQIVTAGQRLAKREQEVKVLIEKAEQGAAGVLVGAIAYRSEYRAVQEDLALVEVMARRKNCLTSDSWRSNSVIQ